MRTKTPVPGPVTDYRFRLPAALLVALLWMAAPAARAAAPPDFPGETSQPRFAVETSKVTVALLPNGTPIQALGRVPRLAPGIFSAGFSDTPPEQTYLDISQGNRVFKSLYDNHLPSVVPRAHHVPGWGRIVARADSAPADIAPGLLASTAQAHHHAFAAAPGLRVAALIAADERGHISRLPRYCPDAGCAPPVRVIAARLRDLPAIVRGLRDSDLLIALERPPAPEHGHLAIGIAGSGFHGNLTSDSTRMRGYVLSTDIAPTILDRVGVEVPSQMSGEPIHSEGGRDIGAVVSLEDRLGAIVDRRGSVIGISLVVWLALTGLAALLGRARPAIRVFALSAIYLPLLLLIGAALEPSAAVERLVVVAGGPLLGALTWRVASGIRGLALACALTTTAVAADVLAGSPLTSLSLIGPDPGLGVRFFGIGNELEATLTVLVLVGTGAALSSLAPALEARRSAAVFVAVALLFAFVFAAGRFGADVGAAIVLPVGGAVAALLISPGGRRSWLWIVALPLLALAGLALVDLLSGGNAHLTRSVLDAGGLHSVGEVAQRRLQLSASSFGRGLTSPFFWIVVVLIAAALWQRRRILAWLRPHPALRAGYLGAAAAIVVGTLANDSGALLLELGTAFLVVVAGYAWAADPEGG